MALKKKDTAAKKAAEKKKKLAAKKKAAEKKKKAVQVATRGIRNSDGTRKSTNGTIRSKTNPR